MFCVQNRRFHWIQTIFFPIHFVQPSELGMRNSLCFKKDVSLLPSSKGAASLPRIPIYEYLVIIIWIFLPLVWLHEAMACICCHKQPNLMAAGMQKSHHFVNFNCLLPLNIDRKEQTRAKQHPKNAKNKHPWNVPAKLKWTERSKRMHNKSRCGKGGKAK